MKNILAWQCKKCGSITPRHELTKESEIGSCVHCGGDYMPIAIGEDKKPINQ
jgi:NAD-dependent SIR2 family protein deacetylase